MSANSLVAFCVGCLFALALATIIVGYLERVRMLRRPPVPTPMPVEEQVTKPNPWPQAPEIP